MLGGFSSIHHELSPPWSLQQLLQMGAEHAFVTACNNVARLVRVHGIERQLLGLLHTTLLDIFDLLCAAESGAESAAAGGSSSSSKAGGGDGVGSTSERRMAAAPAGQAIEGTSSSSSSVWPPELIAAHMGVVIEVGDGVVWVRRARMLFFRPLLLACCRHCRVTSLVCATMLAYQL
jgi:hypothetical protein